MIVIDTHIWFWWVQDSFELTASLRTCIEAHEDSGLLVSGISLLEISRATALGSMELPVSVDEWLRLALGYPGIQIAPLEAAIAIEAYRLPGEFHKDPADRVIVATSRVLGLPLLTMDQKIRAYPHVLLA